MYPVTIKDGFAYADKKLISKETMFFKLGAPKKIAKNCYEHPFELLEPYSSTKEQDILWAELAISKENYEIDLAWILKICDRDTYTRIFIALQRAAEYFSPTEINLMVREIVHRPEKSWISYIEQIILIDGLNGLIDLRIRTRDSIAIDSFNRNKTCPSWHEQINYHNFSDIDKYAYSAKSEIDPFLIKTNGFNQCFKYNNEWYSSVAVYKPNRYESRHRVYIYGCDDSSYSYYCNNFDEAKQVARFISTISEVIYLKHLKALNFEFTN